MDTYELDKIIATMMIEGSQLYILGNKLSEITKPYQKSEEKLTQPIESDYKKAGIDNTASEIMKELKKQNGMITTLLRLQEEMREEGNIATANGIEELISEVKKEGINKFMENHKNKLTGCITYIFDSGVKFFIDKVKVYSEDEIIYMHKQDTCADAAMGMIPVVGTFLGPIAGILDDQQQNNPGIGNNLKVNSLGSAVSNAKIKFKGMNTIQAGKVLGPLYTAKVTKDSLDSENRTKYNEMIFSEKGQNYIVSLHSGVEQITIRCIEESTNKQTSINVYKDNENYISYEKYYR